MTRAALMAVLCLAACSEPSPTTFRVVAGLDDTPFATGSDLAIALVGDDVIDERVFPIDAPTFELPALPFGQGLRFRVEARTGDIVFARGASFPFDSLDGAPPRRSPDVLFGTLGRMTRTTEQQPDARPLVVAAADDGARFVTALGTVYAYRAHAVDGEARLEVLGRAPPHRTTGVWAAMGRRGFIAVGGSSGGASFVHADTGASIELSTGLEVHRQGSTLIGFEEGALVVGGIVDGVPQGAVTWLELRESALVATARSPLAQPVSDARGVSLTARDDAGRLESRALIIGGSGAPTAWVVDPLGQTPPVRSALPLAGLSQAGIASIAPQLVLVCGGMTAAGPTDRMDLLIVDERGAADQLHPRPLATPRAGAAVIPSGSGRALVVGGRGRFSLPHDTAELFEVRLDDLPGEVVPTGHAPGPLPNPHGTLLDDGSILVVDEGLIAIYFSPRST
ncbi:MAG TPA: hypothetical protein ENK57_18205 [Polyangiaceae bacterium]|nr:hypothetical protein [Polyangiaceae bacterium]